MPVAVQRFWQALRGRGYTFMAGVPDSIFQRLYPVIAADPEVRYIPAVREDVALGVVSAAYFVGRRSAVLMQNSGLGNVLNALTSFNLIYQIPVLLLVGWRGYGGPPNDAPEHWVMGAKTVELLELLGLPYALLEPESLEPALDRLIVAMEERSVPGALLVPAGVLA